MPNLKEFLISAYDRTLGKKHMKKITEEQVLAAVQADRNLLECDLTKINLHQILGNEVKFFWFNGSDLSGVRASDRVFIKSEFVNAKLEFTNFSTSELQYCFFNEAMAVDADFARSSIVHCDFRNADLRHTRFTGSHISKCDFRGANLQGTSFVRANLTNCSFDPGWENKNGIMRRAA